MTRPSKQLRGLKDLLVAAVDRGSTAVESVHLATTQRTFGVLEAIPVIDTPSRVVHVIHDASVRSVYSSIRLVNHVVGIALDVAIDLSNRDDTNAPG